MNPVPANSLLLTTGTRRPWNGRSGWIASGRTKLRASPETVFQRKTFMTSRPVGPSTTNRYPTMPCAAGGAPTVKDVRAVAVVEGTTDVMGPPANAARWGVRWRRSCHWSQPSPSATNNTT